MTVKNMSEMVIGETGVVKEVLHSKNMKGRLTELGLISGTEIECIMKNAHGDMLAFCVRGACIALRRGDLEKITVGE